MNTKTVAALVAAIVILVVLPLPLLAATWVGTTAVSSAVVTLVGIFAFLITIPASLAAGLVALAAFDHS